ncbi:Putative ribonuclease H protein [Arachis hypogaea]|nr:Putative ribonuclease H protein [Arachis hypogaea]
MRKGEDDDPRQFCRDQEKRTTLPSLLRPGEEDDVVGARDGKLDCLDTFSEQTKPLKGSWVGSGAEGPEGGRRRVTVGGRWSAGRSQEGLRGAWDEDKLKEWLPESMTTRIMAMAPHLREKKWIALPGQTLMTGPERIRTFLWLVAYQAILTNAERARRHLTNTADCPRCNNAKETLHVLRDCPFTKDVWYRLQRQRGLHDFFNLNIRDWICSNISEKDEWSCLFGVAISTLWFSCNKLIFERKHTQPAAVSLSIKARSEEIINFETKWSHHKKQQVRSERLSRWNSLPEHYLKLNIDGSLYAHNSNAACGVLVIMAVLNRRFHTYIKEKTTTLASSLNETLRRSQSRFSLSFVSSDNAVLPSRLLLSPPVTISLAPRSGLVLKHSIDVGAGVIDTDRVLCSTSLRSQILDLGSSFLASAIDTACKAGEISPQLGEVVLNCIEEAQASHVYSYKHCFKGFAAKLTDEQAYHISNLSRNAISGLCVPQFQEKAAYNSFMGLHGAS